ncbi:CsgG/HfaB family protein [Ralstonia sp. 24A2]|uniref:CsgG/HfaB family protein n=1 Tax=Ralstonia sp. 24A2 TaxID=3447364 RepID=UPI003F69A3B2
MTRTVRLLPQSTYRTCAALLIASLVLLGCASNTAPVSMQFAAKTDAAKYRRVAVLPFDGDGGPKATIDFESMLASVRYEQKPYFTIVDRSQLLNVIGELALQHSGLADPRTASKIGRLTGAEALYSGSAIISPIAYQYSTEPRSVCPKDRKCYTTQVRCTTKTARFELTPRLVEVARGTVVYSETKVGLASSYRCEDQATDDPEQVLVTKAAANAFQQAREDVAPYERNILVKFQSSTDSINPQSVEIFKGSLEFANAGRFDRACTQWADLARANPSSFALQYNLAVCDEVSGRLDAALVKYQQVDAALTKPDADVNAALVRVRSGIAEQEKLKKKPSDLRGSAPQATRR